MGWLNSRRKQIRLSVTLVAVIFIVLFGELPGTSLFWQEVQNTGHTLLFAVVAVLVLLLLQDSTVMFRPASLKLYIVAGLVSLLLGVLAEFVQQLIGRDSSASDIMRDLTGIVTGLGLCASLDSRLRSLWLKSRKIVKVGIIALTLCVISAGLLPLVYLSAAYLQRNEAFPVILNLKEKWAIPFIQTKKAVVQASVANDVTRSVPVQFNPGIYPGVSMIELYPDWSSFKMLTLDIYSEQVEAFDLVVRIHDERHNNDYTDRFNKRLKIESGENLFHISLQEIERAPMGRKMDMAKMSTLVLFAGEVTVPIRFFLGTIRLE